MNIQAAYSEWSGTCDSNENLTRDFDQKVTRNLPPTFAPIPSSTDF